MGRRGEQVRVSLACRIVQVSWVCPLGVLFFLVTISPTCHRLHFRIFTGPRHYCLVLAIYRCRHKSCCLATPASWAHHYPRSQWILRSLSLFYGYVKGVEPWMFGNSGLYPSHFSAHIPSNFFLSQSLPLHVLTELRGKK